ncbi:low molecular weight protein-tyrosine-phosphatase [Bergeyella sp. RCAD1439]|uniref:low molecular weight protein-tyrosine-phosphatase n=1 Tax=Bergeyella anatis TaxID=3113737 RepID=UPI002E18BBEF|nr:low molecular weight protein-tyrosine-phosphatase [Bergeyella sp. RCAD1439]
MKILMLCLGNICRSPLAEGILRAKLGEGFLVDSAGLLSFHEGKPADRRSIQTAERHGIDLSAHRSRPITPRDFEVFDVIYCMDEQNFREACKMAASEEQRLKVQLILKAAGGTGPCEVPDPYYDGMEAFEMVYRLLDEACEVLAEDLQAKEG